MIAKILLALGLLVLLLGADLIAWIVAERREQRAAAERHTEYLDRLATEHGLERRRGESNADLRLRISAAMRRPLAFTRDNLLSIAALPRDVLHVFLVDDSPGVVTVEIVPNDPDVLDQVRAALHKHAPAGIVVNVVGKEHADGPQ